MSFSKYLFAAVVTLFGMSLGALPACAGEKARPNVIILMTDDQGYGDFSCHGNPVLKTPNMDRLWARSIRFTSFHSAPMCTPSRGQIMTGRDALKNGATSVTAGRAFMRTGIPTMAEIFAAMGYKTGLFGKWHLGDNYPHRPMDRGFDKAVYHKGWGFTSAPEFANTLFDGRYFEDGVEKKFSGHCTDFWFDRAMQWIKERKEKNEPFFCYLPTNAPHAPHTVAENYSAPYKGKGKAKLKGAGPAAFFGMIAQIDENLGKLEKFLDDNGLTDNTIFIFMTDNGGTAGVATFNAGMRGQKTTLYEGGHRVPCFIRWPAGKLGEPRDIDTPAQMQDLLPTLIDLCQLQRPAAAEFDGASLAGLLKGTKKSLSDRMLVVQYGQIPKKFDSCVIWNTWRLVHGTELYDLKSDPAQKDDVAAKHPDVLAKMRSHYETWWSKVEPLVNDFVPTTVGSPKEKVTYLTSSDWQDIYSDNAGHVRKGVGGPKGGVWRVLVERAGEYEILLRRWPWEIDVPLRAAAEGKDSVAFPIAAAHLTIAGQEASVKTAANAKEAVIRINLPQGKTNLQAWFQNAQGQDQCGAFFVKIRRID